jgi:hypothetical protein
VGVFAESVLVGVDEGLCCVVDGTVFEGGCVVAEVAVVLVVEVSCGGDEVVGVGELDCVGEFCGTETETPWRGMRMFIGRTSTGIPGRGERMFIEDKSSSRLRRGASKNIRKQEAVSRMPTVRAVREGARMLRGRETKGRGEMEGKKK